MDTGAMSSSSSARFISQIIYPDVDLAALKSDAYLIGWNLDSFRCSVACIVPISTNKLSDLHNALMLSSNDLSGVLSSCSKQGKSKPIVLGELLLSNNRGYIPSTEKQARGIWITLCYDQGNNATSKPILHSLYSLSCKYDTSAYIIRYKRAQSQKLECFFVKRTYRNQKLKHVSSKDERKFDKDFHSGSPKGSNITDLEVIIDHINTANELRHRLDYYLDTAAGRATNTSNYFDIHTPFTSSADQHFSNAIGYMCTGMARVVGVWCAFLKLLARLLNHRFELLRLGSGISHWLGLSGIGSIETSNSASNGVGKGITMRDLSLTSAFVSERASMCSLAVQKCALFPAAWNLPCAMKQRLWLEVHALVLLLWVDILLGTVLGYYLFVHAEEIVQQAGMFCHQVQSTYILETLEWFNHLPGGVKLNTTITQRMSSVLTAVVQSFDWCLYVTRPAHCGLLRFIACCGGFGCSVQLVMLVDLMRLLSLHIALIHRVLSFLHHFLLQCLHSLWLLFNGQKNNILRKRIDTVYFGQDQLLIGIVLFSIVFFVFPNFAAYFFLFALAQFACVTMQYVLYSLSVLLKEFPYYEAVMFVTCPGIMSDGVQFSILPLERIASPSQDTCDLEDRFSVGCLWRSWQAFSAPIATNPANVPARRSPPPRALALRNPLSSQVGSEEHVPLLTLSSTSAARPKGILKSADQIRVRQDDPFSRQMVPHSGSNSSLGGESESMPRRERQGRVTFQGNTVRTIERYPSDGESGHSEEEDRQQQAKQLWENKMGLLQSQRKPAYPTNRSSNTVSTAKLHSNASNTAYIELKSRPMSKTSLFAAYFNHMFYFSNERGVMFRLLSGIVSGRPALDIQLIHGTSDIADRREATERALMQEVVSLAAISAEQARQTSPSHAASPSLSPQTNASSKRLTLPRSVRALKASPTFAESIDAAWAGNERQAFENYTYTQAHTNSQARLHTNAHSEIATSSLRVHSRGLETDALLAGEASAEVEVSAERAASAPRSVHCRTLSRRMLFILLFTLCVHFVVSMTGMALFFVFSGFRDITFGMSNGLTPLKPVGGITHSVYLVHNMTITASATLVAASALVTTVSN